MQLWYWNSDHPQGLNSFIASSTSAQLVGLRRCVSLVQEFACFAPCVHTFDDSLEVLPPRQLGLICFPDGFVAFGYVDEQTGFMVGAVSGYPSAATLKLWRQVFEKWMAQ